MLEKRGMCSPGSKRSARRGVREKLVTEVKMEDAESGLLTVRWTVFGLAWIGFPLAARDFLGRRRSM